MRSWKRTIVIWRIGLKSRRLCEIFSETTKCKNVTEQNLQYPLHFSNSSSKIENAMKVKNKEIQNVIDAMKDIEVPYGSFINHQINEVIIIKIHNDSGINYIVSGTMIQQF